MKPTLLDKLAHLLVHYSIGLRPGEIAGVAATTLAEPLAVALCRAIVQAGAHPIISLNSPGCLQALVCDGSAEQLRFVNPVELKQAETLDACFHLLAGEDTLELQAAPPDMLANLHRGRQPILDTLLRRMETGSYRWIAALFPNRQIAKSLGMSLSACRRLIASLCHLRHPDPMRAWHRQSRRQERLISRLMLGKQLRIWTPTGTDLQLGIEGRVWLNGDGHENLPDGEVFTGPIEDATEGVVCFGLPAYHTGREIRDARLVFKAGRVTEASASHGEDALFALLGLDDGARVLGEAALGCNYDLSTYTRNTLLDEKIGGTFHLALGISYPRTGGKNRSCIHWDLVGDLRNGGTVWVDGACISANGVFCDPQWPQPQGGVVEPLATLPRAQAR